MFIKKLHNSIHELNYCKLEGLVALEVVKVGMNGRGTGCARGPQRNVALVYEPKCGGGGVAGFSANEYSCAHEDQINFGDLTPFLTYGWRSL